MEPATQPNQEMNGGFERHLFLSHSEKDRDRVESLCAELEASGIRCWLSKRDSMPGSVYGAELTARIDEAVAVLLVATQNSVDSHSVKRELEYASNFRIPIITVRLDEVEIKGDVRYFVGIYNYFDAFGTDYSEAAKQVHRALHAWGFHRKNSWGTGYGRESELPSFPGIGTRRLAIGLAALSLITGAFFLFKPWKSKTGVFPASRNERVIAPSPLDSLPESSGSVLPISRQPSALESGIAGEATPSQPKPKQPLQIPPRTASQVPMVEVLLRVKRSVSHGKVFVDGETASTLEVRPGNIRIRVAASDKPRALKIMDGNNVCEENLILEKDDTIRVACVTPF